MVLFKTKHAHARTAQQHRCLPSHHHSHVSSSRRRRSCRRRIIIRMYHHHAVVERAAMAWYQVTRYRGLPILRPYGGLRMLECAVAQQAWAWGKRRAFQLMRRWAADGCWVTVLPAKPCGTVPSPNAPVHLKRLAYLPADLPHRRVIYPPEERLRMSHIWHGDTNLQP